MTIQERQGNHERAEDLVRLWRLRGETIVFTNGCFDLLHRGHLWLFENARRLGQHLVVAVNSDDYCRTVKGPGRPVQTEVLRRRTVQALTGAEIVRELAEHDPGTLLAWLRPDVYVLGSDYRGRRNPGAEHCGRVVFVERLPGISTTESLKYRQTSG